MPTEVAVRKLALPLCLLPTSICEAEGNLYPDLQSYCIAMSQITEPALVTYNQGYTKSQLEAEAVGLDDPLAQRFIREEIDWLYWLYKRPKNVPVDTLKKKILDLCLKEEIFKQTPFARGR